MGYITSNGRMLCEIWICKVVDACDLCFKAQCQHFPDDTKVIYKLVRISGLRGKIRTSDLRM
jgi:archaellum biogenesis ATPase FlaH